MHPDQQYIEALRRNDPRGIRKIYELHAAQALRWVRNNNGTEDDAGDIFQEALMVVYEKSLDPDFTLTCPLGALLHVIWSRKWIDRLRQKNRESAVRKQEETRYDSDTTEDTLVLAEDMLAGQARQERMSRTFIQLSELCRQLLRMLSDGVAPRAAADQLQMNSVDTLYRRKNACTQRWRELYLQIPSTEQP
ncbi:MAG: hypothetical protein IT262_04475 [Saprospiraceae bacterium]|nr:hypothetical protein [Saprospiraceae bacterium]